MASASVRQLLHLTSFKQSHLQFPPRGVVPCSLVFRINYSSSRPSRLVELSGHRNAITIPKASSEDSGTSPVAGEDEEGVSLGTMKLPLDTDLLRFESLLFQWANSLCQGANLPLPVPLKVSDLFPSTQEWPSVLYYFPYTFIILFLGMAWHVDKIPGGARLGFITIGDEGKTEVLVYIDCLIFPATDSSGPFFRAVRNGTKKDQPPPGEPRIMRSLLLALQKSAEIARV